MASYYKTEIALKQYRRAALDTFKREFTFYDRVHKLQLAHQGLLTYMGAFKRNLANESTRYCIATELAPHGTLTQVLLG